MLEQLRYNGMNAMGNIEFSGFKLSKFIKS